MSRQAGVVQEPVSGLFRPSRRLAATGKRAENEQRNEQDRES